jgi:hypothetical protein
MHSAGTGLTRSGHDGPYYILLLTQALDVAELRISGMETEEDTAFRETVATLSAALYEDFPRFLASLRDEHAGLSPSVIEVVETTRDVLWIDEDIFDTLKGKVREEATEDDQGAAELERVFRPVEHALLIRDLASRGVNLDYLQSEVERLAPEPDLPAPQHVTRGIAHILAEIAFQSIAMDAFKDALDDRVATARALGVTWADIGKAAGITNQSAHRRWDPVARRKHNEYQQRRRASPPNFDKPND